MSQSPAQKEKEKNVVFLGGGGLRGKGVDGRKRRRLTFFPGAMQDVRALVGQVVALAGITVRRGPEADVVDVLLDAHVVLVGERHVRRDSTHVPGTGRDRVRDIDRARRVTFRRVVVAEILGGQLQLGLVRVHDLDGVRRLGRTCLLRRRVLAALQRQVDGRDHQQHRHERE